MISRQRQWAVTNRARLLAHRDVGLALRTGQIKPNSQCKQCGAAGELEAHHHRGYARAHRLDVIWLCAECHAKAHNRNRSGLVRIEADLVPRVMAVDEYRERRSLTAAVNHLLRAALGR